MWIWWRLRGERPLPGVHGVLVGQPVRPRGQQIIAVVTRLAPDGVTWGRRSRSHEAAAAALELAVKTVRAGFSRDDELTLIATLVQQFGLSEGRGRNRRKCEAGAAGTEQLMPAILRLCDRFYDWPVQAHWRENGRLVDREELLSLLAAGFRLYERS